MNKYKAVIIDDEQRGAMSLQKMLQHSHPDIEITGLAHSGQEGIAAIQSTNPDLVFLDIQMMDMSGFDMLEQIDSPPFSVIFTTAYDEYALKAFRYAAVDYLLKPIDMDELKEALNKFRQSRMQSPRPDMDRLTQLVQQLKGHNLDRIALPTQEGLIFIRMEEVIRLQSSSNYTTFYLKDKKPLIVSKTMGEFEELLEDQPFIRIHNSHIINLNHVEKYIRGEGGSVVMSDKSEIEVSRRKKDEFLKRLEHVMLKR